jgi:hypothetical protein
MLLKTGETIEIGALTNRIVIVRSGQSKRPKYNGVKMVRLFVSIYKQSAVSNLVCQLMATHCDLILRLQRKSSF